MHPRERRLQRIIVGCQVAVAVVLLVGASLFVRTVQTLDRTEIGFGAEGLVSIEVEPSLKELERFFPRLALTQQRDEAESGAQLHTPCAPLASHVERRA